MKSLIDLEEEQRRNKLQADSAIRKDKVSSGIFLIFGCLLFFPLSTVYMNLHIEVTSTCRVTNNGKR